MATQESHEMRHGGHFPADLRLQLLALLSMDPAQPVKMTYQEFLDWTDEDTYAEWVDGRVVFMPSPASIRHQYVAQFLTALLSTYAEVFQRGTVVAAPFQMRLENSGREPDVFFLASEHRDRLKQTYLDGPADLVIEVISPESRGRDRGEKFYEYEFAGIPEYWLIDPDTRRAEFYQLDEKGNYQLVPPDADGKYSSRVLPDFWLRADWLWSDPLPSVDQVLLEVAGERYARHMMDQLRQQGYLDQQ